MKNNDFKLNTCDYNHANNITTTIQHAATTIMPIISNDTVQMTHTSYPDTVHTLMQQNPKVDFKCISNEIKSVNVYK